MQRSSNGRFIKTPCDSIRYDYDMLGNFIGISPQLFSPKTKQESGKNAGKKKEASEGIKTPVTKKLRLENDTEFIAVEPGWETSREESGNLKQVRLCMLIVCLSLMLIHTC